MANNQDVQGILDFFKLDVDPSVVWIPIGPGPLKIGPDPKDQPQSLLENMGIGPDSGQVTDIAIDPKVGNDQTIYVATNGGVWKTMNGGAKWLPTMEPLLSLSIGAVAVDPDPNKKDSSGASRTVYAGTGNPLFAPPPNRPFTRGVGLYRSDDAGSTWYVVDGGALSTVFAGKLINRIVVTVPDTLLVATNDGLFRSIDGGRHFGGNAPDFNDRQAVQEGFISGLLIDVDNPATVYACVKNVGVKKSTDSGATFPLNLFTQTNGAPALGSFGNLQLAQSKKDKALFAIVQKFSLKVLRIIRRVGLWVRLYKSIDGGVTWSWVSHISKNLAQADYDLTLGVDPQDPALVYAGLTELWKSTAKGGSFLPKPCTRDEVHWDHHALVFSPNPGSAPTTVYVGTDGGLAKSSDGGNIWSAINGEIQSNLFRGIDIGKGPANNAYTYGGCQDVGTSGHLPNDAGTDWHCWGDADGDLVAVDPSNPTIIYGFLNQYFIKLTDVNLTDASVSLDRYPDVGKNLPVDGTVESPNVRKVIALGPQPGNEDSRIVYVGILNHLYMSRNAGEKFEFSHKVKGNILAVTTAEPTHVWVGVDDGSVHFSDDGGKTWDKGLFIAYPGSLNKVHGIAVDPSDASRVAVVYGGVSGIHPKYRTRHVFLSTNQGRTWNDISGTDGLGPKGNLPDLPLHSVVFDTSESPSAIIVASDAGVLRCTNATGGPNATWKRYGLLPTVLCKSLAIDNTVPSPVLRVGTWGRSCFEATRPIGDMIRIDSNLAFGVVPVGGSAKLSISACNCGPRPVKITGITPTGSADFALSPPWSLDVTIPLAGTQTFNIVFTPSSAGDQTASFQISGKAPVSPAVVFASGSGVTAPLAPRLATDPISATGFGLLDGSPLQSIPLALLNVGTAPLNISAINVSGSSDFTVGPAPTNPIAPGAQTQVDLKYHPTGHFTVEATFEIVSDDPNSPRVVVASGTGIPTPGWLAEVAVLMGVAKAESS